MTIKRIDKSKPISFSFVFLCWQAKDRLPSSQSIVRSQRQQCSAGMLIFGWKKSYLDTDLKFYDSWWLPWFVWIIPSSRPSQWCWAWSCPSCPPTMCCRPCSSAPPPPSCPRAAVGVGTAPAPAPMWYSGPWSNPLPQAKYEEPRNSKRKTPRFCPFKVSIRLSQNILIDNIQDVSKTSVNFYKYEEIKIQSMSLRNSVRTVLRGLVLYGNFQKSSNFQPFKEWFFRQESLAVPGLAMKQVPPILELSTRIFSTGSYARDNLRIVLTKPLDSRP